MASGQGGCGYMGVTIMVLEVIEDAVYVALGGMGDSVECRGKDML